MVLSSDVFLSRTNVDKRKEIRAVAGCMGYEPDAMMIRNESTGIRGTNEKAL